MQNISQCGAEFPLATNLNTEHGIFHELFIYTCYS